MSALMLANPIATAFVAPVQSRPTLRANTPMMAVAEPMAEPPAAPKPMRKCEMRGAPRRGDVELHGVGVGGASLGLLDVRVDLVAVLADVLARASYRCAPSRG